MAQTVMVQVGTLLNTRLVALDVRLLRAKPPRPPLAADKRRQMAVPWVEAEPTVTTLVAPSNLGPIRKQGTKKAIGEKGGKKALQAAPAELRSLPPAPADVIEGWNV